MGVVGLRPLQPVMSAVVKRVPRVQLGSSSILVCVRYIGYYFFVGFIGHTFDRVMYFFVVFLRNIFNKKSIFLSLVSNSLVQWLDVVSLSLVS